jgi:peptidyl-prolyl cis-trans isomerase A (cyclophilin A)
MIKRFPTNYSSLETETMSQWPRSGWMLAVLFSWALTACDGKSKVTSPEAASPPGGETKGAPMEEKAGAAPAKKAAEEPAGPHPALLDPALAKERAPDSFRARFETTKGPFVIEVTRSWSPRGADRFYNLVTIGYFQDIAFFRVLSGFMAQCGIHGDPAVSARWRSANIQDDPVVESNGRGYVTFATGGPNTRTTQLFINFANNSNLDGMGFSPFGKVVEGMEVVDKIYSGYGEGAPRGRGPDQGRIQFEGNAYLKEAFPMLDYIQRASIVE